MKAHKWARPILATAANFATELSLWERIMAKWTLEEPLTFDIAFALKKVTIPGFRKALTEEHRLAIAKTILDHVKLCRWEFSKPP